MDHYDRRFRDMDPYERKLREMEQYLPFLEEKISLLKKIKLKDNYPDPERERKLQQYQGMYRVLTNKEKKTTVPTLEKFEEIIKKIQKQDYLDRRARKDIVGQDPNPFHNPDAYRPSSSCSNASSGSGTGPYRKRFENCPASPSSSSAANDRKKVFDDCPASPSPPRSPAPHPSSGQSAPIIIPTERRSRFGPIESPPPPPPLSPPRSSHRYLFSKSPSPPEIPKTVPITRIDVNEIGPLEWDTDEEEDTAPKPRPEIVVPKMDVIGAFKKLGDRFPRKEDIPPVSKRDLEPSLSHHPSDNIPTVQVNALGGSRRLKTVIEKTNLLNTDFNRILSSHRPASPLINVLEEGLRSPDPEILQHSGRPFSPPASQRREKVPMTPSLLLNAPPTNSRLPIPIDDIAEYLDEGERNNLVRHDKQPTRPVSRMPMPTSSPIMVSSDVNTMLPCLTDPRGDPRSRSGGPIIGDPRSHGMGPNDSRSHGLMASGDPRQHIQMPSADPRSHGSKDPRNLGPSVPRYADNYERHKRTMPREEPKGPNDFQRQRHMEQYGPEIPMGSPTMHGMPSPVITGPTGFNPMNQMGPVNYDYRMGSSNGPGGPMPPSQQQWNGPPHPHMQPGPPQPVPAPYQMGGQGPGWQNSGMHPDMNGGHSMMNGDSRIPPAGYPNQMPLMSTNVAFGMAPQNRYGDSRPSYDMPYDQQQPPTNEFQRGRPSWASGSGNRMSSGDPNERFTSRPNTPFSRIANSWNKDAQQQRPNRDPRLAPMKDRDPRSRPESRRPCSPPLTAKEAPVNKGPPPNKEIHLNKLAKQTEKEVAAKKRPDSQKLDTHRPRDKEKEKEKDRDKDRDRDRNRDKDKNKEKSKTKSRESMQSPLTDLYGAIDAKKAMQKPGLQKFKIPKKRPSIDTRPDPTHPSEENWDDDEAITSSSTSHESAGNKYSESVSSTTSKKSTKTTEKGKEKEKDKETTSAADKIDIFKQFAAKHNFSLDDEDMTTIVKQLMKFSKAKKAKKKTIILSSDESEDNSDEQRPSSSTSKKLLKKKKKQVIFSSSDESEASSETLPVISSKKEKQRKDTKNLTNKGKEDMPGLKTKTKEKKIENKKDKETEKEKLAKTNKEGEKEKKDTENEKEKVANKEKETEFSIPEKISPKQKAKKASIDEPASGKEDEPTTEEAEPAEKEAEEPAASDATPVEAPAKPKPKRRFRELDMLQEDLKSSWICDGAMKATGSRTCSQKNKVQEQEHQTTGDEESGSTPTTKPKTTAGKKKPQTAKSKLGAKSKKTLSEISLLASSDSEEDDLPLSRRSEGITDLSSSSAKAKNSTTKSTTNKKARKSLPKVPPPLFDESSNDSFNLDASTVEPSTDISLHPEPNEKKNTKGKSQKKGVKKAVPATDAAAESSSDESFVSNASSSLLDTSVKQRDNNEEVLENVMAALAVNSKYAAKKKQPKKKKNNWQMGNNSVGILSKKKKKKATAATGKADESTNDITVDMSVSNETDVFSKENDTTVTSISGKKHDSLLDRTENLNEDEETVWKSAANTADDEELIARVDPDALIGYTLSGQDKYQCLLCPFYRKNIVHHYKMVHPRKEVLISRLSVSSADMAIKESNRLDFENNATQAVEKDVGKYSCRFCTYVTKGVDNYARESFYEHCTNHTGEYRFSCQNCSYEAVAKGSIRTHYYKECRKHSGAKNLNEAINEYPLPTDDKVYGYLCSKCNFVQLRKINVEKHVKMWHSKERQEEVKIVKIDMSLNLKDEHFESKNHIVDSTLVSQKVELKDEKEGVARTAITEEADLNIKEDLADSTASTAGPERISDDESEIRVMLEATEQKPTKIEKGSNLSAFVCASKLEDKDMEIQNERKKKMQEIAQNIGIKVDKDETQKRLSIIDKLKDRIETTLPMDEGETTIPGKVEVKLTESTVSAEETEDAVDPLQIPEQTCENEHREEIPTVTESVQVKKDPESISGEEKEDKTNAKLKDPLAFVNEPVKRIDSDDEEPSDGEQSVPPVQYDSDTSPEQSDHEISTDVSSILKSTEEDMRTSAKGPTHNTGIIMTTIHRLATQLQNTKSLDTSQLPEPETIIADMTNGASPMKIKKEKTSSPRRSIEDMAVLSPVKIKNEVKKEPVSPKKNAEEEAQTMETDSLSKQSTPNSPKTFIRIRRISGDKLSRGGEQESALNNENKQSDTSMATIEPINPNTEEDTGFLKIANVISLAPKDNDNQNAPNIRKAMEASPQKMKGLSLLKKPNSYILKRVDGTSSVVTSSGETVKLIPLSIPPTSRTVPKPENYISIGGQPAVAIKIDSKGVAVPLTVSSAGTAPTTLVSSANQSFKIVKLSSPDQVSVAIKLKSANVYEKMLKDEKLIHMFKCMGRDCCLTTSSELAFHKHLRKHDGEVSNRINNEPKDYFKCAYCYIDCKNYDDLMTHLKQMHIFCRYCCKYCFYRAFAYSYVEIHQKTFHQMKKVHILVVSEELVQMPPPPKRLERKQIIKPYVCVHDCNKYFFIPEAFILHLNMHHTNIVSGFECHLCQGTVNTVENLIEHYKQHGYFKFHCMYCPHGSPSIKELHNHLSTAHYNQPPHVLERCLPREISKNLSAIDQLRVRDVDAIYRQRKGPMEEEHGKVAIPPLIKTSNSGVSILPNAPIVTAKIISPKESNQFVPLTSLDGGVSNIRILDARSLSSNAPASLLNIGKNIKVTVKEAPKLSSNDTFTIHTVDDDNSEFVDTNLLDRTDLSDKNVKKETSNKPENNKPVDNTNVDYDSDIEIIEDYTTLPSNATKEKDEKLPIKKEETTDEVSAENIEQEISETEELPQTAPATPMSWPAPSKSPTDSPNPSGRFLTIEDVKGSGFAGRELYRCGYESCQESVETAEELRVHMQQCVPNDEEGSKIAIYCVHCGTSSKKFEKPTFLLDHLKKHGLKRFSCAVCNAKFAAQSQAQLHIRSKHKWMNSKIVPADPTNPSSDGLFIVHPVGAPEKVKGKKNANRSPEKDASKTASEMEKTTFGPNETDSLPLQAIYNRAVQCAVCPYSNKVRSNMLRHLQAHLKDESVPESSPVNPVPCLDKKERMFDKMVNLASSSHENGRMGGGCSSSGGHKDAAKMEEEESLPKYVPENKRYVCGVPECNYLTVEEAMLRHHLKALHSDEVYFRCPHCPPPNGQDLAQNIALEKMGVHLKMHDSRLYKCSHCIYHHYHRHVVERHLTDKHPEKRPFVKVIRELQTEESQQQQQQPSEPEELEQPDPDGNTWKCNLCYFKCVLKGAMQTHAANEHNEKCQFKCNGCPFKAISWVTFNQHMETKHVGEPNVNYTTIYQRIKGLKKPEPVEPVVPQDEPFDTTPLWRRDMPRIRHIRGILLEEEEESSEMPAKSGTKRKLDSEPGNKLSKIKGNKSGTADDSKKARVSFEDPERLKMPDGGYGPYGNPTGDQYVCTVCNQFKSKYKHDFRDHLYRDLKYLRWYCTGCTYKAVNRGSITKHISTRHITETVEALQYGANEQIEEWVATVIKTQTDIMKSVKPSTTPNLDEEDEEAPESEGEDDDLVIDVKEEEENENSDDEKSSAEMLSAPLICKHCHMTFIKWRGFKRHVQLKHLKRLRFLCPYCDRSTNSEAVMLQHVRSKHRDLPEKVVENITPQTGELTAEFWEHEYGLIVPKRPKKRKRKDSADENSTKVVDHELPCDKCDFTAMTVAGLKSHIRTHETRIRQKCNYCTFLTFNPSEMRQHWEVNHAHQEFKIEEAIVSAAAMDSTNARSVKKAKIEDEKKTTVYYCYYCTQVACTSLDEVRNHWKEQHMDSSQPVVFKYKEHVEATVKCAYCAEPGTKSSLINHIRQKHGADKPILGVEREEDGWMCKWCGEEYFTNKDEMDYHRKMFHSHLPTTNYKLVRRTFVCKHCQFDTISLDTMQKHAKQHLNFYRCKFCSDKFKSFSAVKHHFKLAHLDKEPETRTITSEDIAKEIDVIVKESVILADTQLSPMKVPPSPHLRSPPSSPRVAKKSTTKQIVKPMRPFPNKIKAVARKSTNPLPRYPSGIVFETEQQEPIPKYVSYYGQSPLPINLNKVNSTCEVAGMKVKVNWATLVKQSNLNIKPILRITDFRKEISKGRR